MRAAPRRVMRYVTRHVMRCVKECLMRRVMMCVIRCVLKFSILLKIDPFWGRNLVHVAKNHAKSIYKALVDSIFL